MKKAFLSVALASVALLTVSGCSVIEDFLPQDDQPTLDLFAEENTTDSIFVEPEAPESNSAPESGESGPPNDSEGSSLPDPTEQPTEENQPVEEETVTTIAGLYDALDGLVAYSRNSCVAEDALGSITKVDVSATETPLSYEIVYVPESQGQRDIRAVAYYPATPENINPEIIEAHSPHACALEDFYPKQFLELIPSDAPLTDPAPANIRISRTSNTFVVRLPEQIHTLIVANNVIIRSEIITTEKTTLREISYGLSEAQEDLFVSLYRYSR